MQKRDAFLDQARGAVMIYIICVIHVLYWLDLGNEPFRSYFLVEMPFIFYISGAAFSVSAQKPYLSFLKSRFFRIILPYYKFGVLSVLLTLLLHYMHNHEILSLSWFHLREILMLNDLSFISYCYHLWFIIPYVLIMLAAPFLLFMNKKIDLWLIGLLFYIIIIGFDVTGIRLDMLRKCLVYGFFFVVGFQYKKGYNYTKLIILVFLVCLYLLISDKIFGSMQLHKFPPDATFLTFGLVALGVAAVLRKFITLPSLKILSFWNKEGYTLYLWQCWFFTLYTIVFHPLRERYSVSAIWWILLSGISIFCIATACAWTFRKMENGLLSSIRRYMQNV